MKNSEELIDDFLHGSLDENGQAELRAWLKRDPANMRQFTRALMFDEQIRATIHTREIAGASHPLTGAGGLTDQATSGTIIPFPQRLRGKLPWLAAAAALVVISLSVWKTIVPPTPVPLARLDARWVLEPTAGADYRVLDTNRVELRKGELRLHSLQPASMVVETPGAIATAQGTDFFIGTHAAKTKDNPQPNNQERNNKMKLKMQNLTRVLVLTGVVTLTNAHGETTGKADNLLVAEAGKAPVNHAIAANSDFAVGLYGALAKENVGKNLFFSPYSVSSALAMTAEGARGETADQMGKVLGFPEAAKRIGSDAQLLPWNTSLIHTGMSELNERFKPKPVSQELRDKIAAARAELAASKKREGDFKNADKQAEHYRQVKQSNELANKLNELLPQVDQYELGIANALYGEKTYPFQQAYLDTINKFYGTGAVEPVDFIKDFETVRGQINTRVENQTKQLIKDLIPKGGLNELTSLVLINAIYFKGDWAVPFDAKNTKKEEFLSPGAKASVPMMRQDGMGGGRYGSFNADGSFFKTPQLVSALKKTDPKTLYPGNDGFLMAELPYKGKELSMVVVVPQDAGGLGAVEAKLTSANLQTWLGKLEDREVNVQIPKFKLETDYQKMGDTLKSMGMVRAFEDPRDPVKGAQFDGMCASSDPDLKLYITKVFHKAFVEVNEKGTEAAAATAVSMRNVASEPIDVPFTPTFRADKPFLFAIRDVKTGTILFLGRVVDPTK